jgi:hypothetical protein
MAMSKKKQTKRKEAPAESVKDEEMTTTSTGNIYFAPGAPVGDIRFWEDVRNKCWEGGNVAIFGLNFRTPIKVADVISRIVTDREQYHKVELALHNFDLDLEIFGDCYVYPGSYYLVGRGIDKNTFKYVSVPIYASEDIDMFFDRCLRDDEYAEILPEDIGMFFDQDSCDDEHAER